uniref:Uncharacterized protein n=1 Tax=Oryza nivara TaxID=4536 RepID=A0A0E0JC87_ORYNI
MTTGGRRYAALWPTAGGGFGADSAGSALGTTAAEGSGAGTDNGGLGATARRKRSASARSPPPARPPPATNTSAEERFPASPRAARKDLSEASSGAEEERSAAPVCDDGDGDLFPLGNFAFVLLSNAGRHGAALGLFWHCSLPPPPQTNALIPPCGTLQTLLCRHVAL